MTPPVAPSGPSAGIALAAVLPIVVVWALVAPGLALRPMGETTMNPAAAINRGDFAQAVRQIEAGAPVAVAYPDPTPDDPGRMRTPLQEAIRAGDRDLVRVLVQLGALPDEAARLSAACYAEAAGEAGIAGLPSGSALPAGTCDPRLQP